MKVILEYDQGSGQITDASGTVVANWFGLMSFQKDEQAAAPVESQALVASVKADQAIKLKEAGFTADEILKLL